MRDVGVRHGCEKISLKVTVLPGLDGDPTLLSGFVARQPEWASSHVVAVPWAPSRTYRELSDVLATKLDRAPDVLIAESFSGPAAVLQDGNLDV